MVDLSISPQMQKKIEARRKAQQDEWARERELDEEVEAK